MAGRNSTTTRAKLNAKEWRERAVKLAEKGYTIREIAKMVGRSPSRVHEAIDEALNAVPVEAVKSLRKRRAEGLAKQIRIWNRLALKGDPKAVEALVKLEAREAKLLGLDEPVVTKNEQSGLVGTFDPTTLTDEQLDRYLATRDIRAALAGSGGEGTPAKESGQEG